MKNKSKKMRYTLLIFLIISSLITTPASAVEKTASQKAVVWLPIAKATILLGQDYFQTTQHAIEEAKESIYVAMYLINVEPTPTDNPASILLESLINAHKRGVFVKLILDDTKFSINYNAYKRLKDAGVDVYLDSPQAVLHGKAIVIDSQICILGSFNWSRASLYDNYEFATYIEDPQLARTLLDYFNRIELRQDKHLKQADLAKKLGVTQQFISQIETAEERNLTIETLIKIAKSLGRGVKISFPKLSGQSPSYLKVT